MSSLVPPSCRNRWREEWEAELVFAWRRMEKDGRPSPMARRRLRWRALGSTITTYVVVTGALVGVAWIACWAPAARAARIQPSRALEAE